MSPRRADDRESFVRVIQSFQEDAGRHGGPVVFSADGGVIDTEAGTAAAQIELRQERPGGEVSLIGSIFVRLAADESGIVEVIVQHGPEHRAPPGPAPDPRARCVFC